MAKKQTPPVIGSHKHGLQDVPWINKDTYNWMVGMNDTGVSARGPEGFTPYVGENNNWWIGEEDTGIVARGSTGARGADGLTPYVGVNGNWWIGAEDSGVPASGVGVERFINLLDVLKPLLSGWLRYDAVTGQVISDPSGGGGGGSATFAGLSDVLKPLVTGVLKYDTVSGKVISDANALIDKFINLTDVTKPLETGWLKFDKATGKVVSEVGGGGGGGETPNLQQVTTKGAVTALSIKTRGTRNTHILAIPSDVPPVGDRVAGEYYIHMGDFGAEGELPGGGGGGDYTLPTASPTVKGGVKVGTGLEMNGDTLNAVAGPAQTPNLQEVTTKGAITTSVMKARGLRSTHVLAIPPDAPPVGDRIPGEYYVHMGSFGAEGELPPEEGSYTLPTASSSVKGGFRFNSNSGFAMYGGQDLLYIAPASETLIGGVRVGDNIKISETQVISLPVFSKDESGAVPKTSTTPSSTKVLSQTGWKEENAGGTSYTLPTATSGIKGGVKVGTGLSMSGEVLNNTIPAYSLPAASASIRGGVRIGTGLSLTNGDTLNQVIPGFADLSDTAISSLKVGDSFKWDGTKIVNTKDLVADKLTSKGVELMPKLTDNNIVVAPNNLSLFTFSGAGNEVKATNKLDALNGYSATELNVVNSGGIYRQFSLKPLTQYTFSLYVKRGTADNVVVTVWDNVAWNAFAPQLTSGSTGWTRLTKTFTTNANGFARVNIGAHSYPSGTAQSAGTIQVFGLKIEEGNIMTAFNGNTYGLSLQDVANENNKVGSVKVTEYLSIPSVAPTATIPGEFAIHMGNFGAEGELPDSAMAVEDNTDPFTKAYLNATYGSKPDGFMVYSDLNLIFVVKVAGKWIELNIMGQLG